MFQMGEIVFYKYKITDFLGKGAFGQVYLAEHINLKVNRALKCIRRCPEYQGFDNREADILKNLRHPSIPIIYDIEENEDCVCIIEEYVDGMSLNSFIKQHFRFSTRKIVELVLQLCDVLSYLHSKGILHGDIKPENIMYDKGRLFLLDYGNARNVGRQNLPIMGTKGFAAPEAYVSKELYSGSEVYSIGVLMLLLATGKKDTKALERIASKKLRYLVTKCLAHSEKERIKDVKELTKELNKIIKLKAKSKEMSLKVGFAGAYSHCGVTHCAILAGKYYQNKSYKVILCERNCSNDYLKLLSHKNHISFCNGVFKAGGLCYVPWYYQCVNPEISPDVERIIYDYGVLNEDTLGQAFECDVLCIVTGARAYEREASINLLKRIINDNNFNGKIYVLVNLASIKDYREFIKRKEIINPVRVGYCPEI